MASDLILGANLVVSRHDLSIWSQIRAQNLFCLV